MLQDIVDITCRYDGYSSAMLIIPWPISYLQDDHKGIKWTYDGCLVETKGAIFSDTLLMAVIIGRAAKDRK